jgi:hypothetical protein
MGHISPVGWGERKSGGSDAWRGFCPELVLWTCAFIYFYLFFIFIYLLDGGVCLLATSSLFAGLALRVSRNFKFH